MSVKSQEPDFEKLQQLLKLKRHESPPPRYFNDFSSKIADRIRAGDVGKLDSFEDVVSQAPWLRRLWQAIEGRPAVSGAFAAVVCGLLAAGIIFADKAPNTLPTFAENGKQTADPKQQSLFATASMGTPSLASSTNPTAILPNSLFGMPVLQTVPASGMPIQSSPR